MRILAVDPGLRGCGCSALKDGQLTKAWYRANPEMTRRGPPAWEAMADAVWSSGPEAQVVVDGPFDWFVVEYPQVYQPRFQKGDQADLIEVAGVAGALVGRIPAEYYDGFLPREWKGQVPKEIHNRRTLLQLSSEEKGRIIQCPASLMHNVLDGVGLGLFFAKRMGDR